MAKRLNVRISSDVYDEVKVWAERLGLTMSQLGGMCVYSGIRYISRAVDPLEAIDDRGLERLLSAFERVKGGEV